MDKPAGKSGPRCRVKGCAEALPSEKVESTLPWVNHPILATEALSDVERGGGGRPLYMAGPGRAAGPAAGALSRLLAKQLPPPTWVLQAYYRRYRICVTHAVAPIVTVAGRSQRFCQL